MERFQCHDHHLPQTRHHRPLYLTTHQTDIIISSDTSSISEPSTSSVLPSVRVITSPTCTTHYRQSHLPCHHHHHTMDSHPPCQPHYPHQYYHQPKHQTLVLSARTSQSPSLQAQDYLLILQLRRAHIPTEWFKTL